MKVKETEDKYGRALLIFTGIKKFSEVTDFLFCHYQGYKFAILIDVSQEEGYESDNTIYVNFLDELEEEIMEFNGYNHTIENYKDVYRKR